MIFPFFWSSFEHYQKRINFYFICIFDRNEHSTKNLV